MVIAPDAYKGCLSAQAVAAAMARGLAQGWPEAVPVLLPMADGGEGTLEALAQDGPVLWRTRATVDALGRPVIVPTLLGQDADGPWAALESAAMLGLPGAPGSVDGRHSGGLGVVLRALLQEGQQRILIGLGGTSVVDGGAGLLDALGARFRDAQGRVLRPVPRSLLHAQDLDLRTLEPLCASARLIALADVDNPLLGSSGAVACYGLQKGIVPEEAADFEHVLARLAELYETAFGGAVAQRAGAGAAGGLGAALAALGATLVPGAAEIGRRLQLESQLAQAAWALTGEGRADAQTLQGKVPWQVATLARRYQVPVCLISGGLDVQAAAALDAHFESVECLSTGPVLSAEDTREGLASRTAALARAYGRRFHAGRG